MFHNSEIFVQVEYRKKQKGPGFWSYTWDYLTGRPSASHLHTRLYNVECLPLRRCAGLEWSPTLRSLLTTRRQRRERRALTRKTSRKRRSDLRGHRWEQFRRFSPLNKSTQFRNWIESCTEKVYPPRATCLKYGASKLLNGERVGVCAFDSFVRLLFVSYCGTYS